MPPIRALPPGYREVAHVVATESRRLLVLNLLAVVPLLAAVVGMALWWGVVVCWRGLLPGPALPWWAGLALVALVLPLHEGIHAAAIRAVGHRPRIGAKLDKGVLYATADDALFRRGEFLAVALAPLVGITLLGMGLVAVLPDPVGYWVGMGVAFNAGSAIGDLWMVKIVLAYPPSALVRDEADGIRLYIRQAG